MQAQNPDFKTTIREIFKQAPFISLLGIELVDLGAGWVETQLVLQNHHLQQNDVVHAGVQATMADHTAGATAATLIAANEYVLTVEFKINLLRTAQGEKLVCRAEVLKPGSRFSVVESEVFMVTGDDKKLASKAMVTIATLPKGSR